MQRRKALDESGLTLSDYARELVLRERQDVDFLVQHDIILRYRSRTMCPISVTSLKVQVIKKSIYYRLGKNHVIQARYDDAALPACFVYSVYRIEETKKYRESSVAWQCDKSSVVLSENSGTIHRALECLLFDIEQNINLPSRTDLAVGVVLGNCVMLEMAERLMLHGFMDKQYILEEMAEVTANAVNQRLSGPNVEVKIDVTTAKAFPKYVNPNIRNKTKKNTKTTKDAK